MTGTATLTGPELLAEEARRAINLEKQEHTRGTQGKVWVVPVRNGSQC